MSVNNAIRSLSIVAVVFAVVAAPGSAQQARQTQVAGETLELDGILIGLLHSEKGGDASAPVVSETAGAGAFAKKHLGQVKYSDFDTQIGFDLNKDIYQWIEASWKQNYARKDGSIKSSDYQMNVISEKEFFGALITETTLPACDGSSKEVEYLRLKFKPEFVRHKPGSGKIGAGNARHLSSRFLASNFRLSINGVDCTKVSKVDSFTIKQPVTADAPGEERDPTVTGKIEFPNLKITIAEAFAGDFRSWFEDFVIKGNCSDDQEKSGKLEFLSPNLQDVLLTINFFGLGIFKLAPEEAEPKNCDCDLCQTVVDGANSANRVRRLVAQLYCERMEFRSAKMVGQD